MSTHERYAFVVKNVTIYTDGACLGNPGPGGWGALLMYNEHKKEISGAQADTPITAWN